MKKRFILSLVILLLFIGLFGASRYMFYKHSIVRIGDYDYCFTQLKTRDKYENVLFIEGYHGSEKNIKLPSRFLFWKVKVINYYAFINNTDIESVEFSENITYIYGNAFDGCERLSRVKLNEGLKGIDLRAFAGCKSLIEINLPESLEVIEALAFSGCISLEKIYLPDNLDLLSYNVFSGCKKLSDVTGGNGLEEIGTEVFKDTSWIKNYEGDFVQLNNILLSYKGNAKSVVIPNNIVYVNEDVFKQSEVDEIYMPNSASFKSLLFSSEYIESHGKIKVYFDNPEVFENINNKEAAENLIFVAPKDNIVIKYAQKNGIEYIIKE